LSHGEVDQVHEVAARRPGRPRSAQADQAILSAAIELLVEDGFEGMSMEGIATRAGVGKTTVYRRWTSKEEVVAAALRTLDENVAIPDTGSAHGDLSALINEFGRATKASMIWPALRRVVGTAVSTPALLAILWANVLTPRQAAVRTILERGITRGELRPDLDVAFAVDAIAGTLLFQVIFRPGELEPPSQELADQIVDVLWFGLASEHGAGQPVA
jgi:AcrR family transcriptional regulator